jgi:acyl carrier protein
MPDKTMTNDDVLAKIADLMVDVFDLDDFEVTRATSADDIEDWDSLSHIRFMITLERAFKVKFSNEEIAELKNVGELADVVTRKLAG